MTELKPGEQINRHCPKCGRVRNVFTSRSHPGLVKEGTVYLICWSCLGDLMKLAGSWVISKP